VAEESTARAVLPLVAKKGLLEVVLRLRSSNLVNLSVASKRFWFPF
jgi:hypothetical protein